jgi:alpha-glucosidase (family GH31 glycosyl hydrolase)
MYTRFFHAHVNGTPVVQPLFFQYPMDASTYAIDRQFLWGSALLITPVLTQGAVKVSAYFPADLWYDVVTGILTSNKAQTLVLDAPLNNINVHVRGGSIVPRQTSAVTTTLARTKPFSLLVALNQSGEASGALFWDDGELLESVEREQFTYIYFEAAQGSLVSKVLRTGYQPAGGLSLEGVTCMGVLTMPTVVTLNGISVPYAYNAVIQELFVFPLQVDLLHAFSLVWQH